MKPSKVTLNPVLSILVCTVVGLNTIACGDPLKYPQDLDEARILGVRVATEGGLAWPGRGDVGHVSILTAGPSGPVDLRGAYQSCVALKSSWGVPQCSETMLAEGEFPASSNPGFEFDGVALGEDERVAIIGVLCESGDPMLDGPSEDWGCSDASRALRFSFESGSSAIDNTIPTLDGTRISYDGDPIELVEQDMESELPSCDDAYRLEPGKTIEVRIELAPEVRDEGEVLQISHYSTAGRFERQFSILDPDEDLLVDLEFVTNEETGPLRSYLVVRDEAGGTNWITWDACIE